MLHIPKTLKPILPAAALTLLIVIGSPSVANARQGNENARSNVTTTEVAATDDMATTTETDSTTEESTEKRNAMRAEARTKAQAEVKALREERKVATTAERREKICESRKKALETKMTSISTNALRYQTRIDAILARLPASVATSVEAEYAAALAAQEQSAASVADLTFAEQGTTIDCTNTNVSTEIVAYKTVAATARDDLKTYKMAVKDVLKALKSVTTETTETEPTTDTDTEPATKPEVIEEAN